MILENGTYWVQDCRDSSWTIVHVVMDTLMDVPVRAYHFLGGITLYRADDGSVIAADGKVSSQADFIERILSDDAIIVTEINDTPPPIYPEEEPQGEHNPELLDQKTWPMFNHEGKEVVLSFPRQ
jgi:hypothetical protein